MPAFSHVFGGHFPRSRGASATPTPTPTPAPTPTPTPRLPAYASIATFGDSITVGISSSNNATKSWAALVASGCGATLLNAGVSGTVLQNSNDSGGAPRASNGRDRFGTDVLGSNKKAALFIAYGFNDARYTGAPSTFNVTQYQADYRELLNGLILGGYARGDLYIGSPYMISTTGLTTGSAGFTGQTRAGFEAFVAAAAAVAAEFGTNYCDLYAATNNATFTTNTDANDNIHPTDTGHAMIATAWQTQTIAANTRPAPATVSVSASGTTLTVTASAVTGAASYEYALILNPVDYASNTSGSFTSVAPGSYSARARAVFGDGSKGPWTFSTATASVAAPSGIFAQDSFTDTAGTTLTAHTPEVGGWAAPTGGGLTITSAGRVFTATTSAVLRNTGVPSGADYYVEAVIDFVTAGPTSETVGIAARMDSAGTTLYWARHNKTTGAWELWKTVATISTELGTRVTANFTSGSKTLRLTVTGSTIALAVDGSTLISVTDTSITAAGYAGTRNGVAQTSTTGRQITSFVAST